MDSSSSHLSNASSLTSLSRPSPATPGDSASYEGLSAEALSLHRLSGNLERLLFDPDPDLTDADIVLSGDAGAVPVHRCILAARSTVFRDYFAGGSNSKCRLEEFVPAGAVGKDALMVFLGFLYTGKLQPFPVELTRCADPLCPHDACRPAIIFVVQLMYAAAAFLVDELVSIFQRRLHNFVDKALVEDVVPIFHVAHYSEQLATLRNHCIQRISKSNLDNLYIEKEFPKEISEEIIRSCKCQQDSKLSNVNEKRVRRIQRALDADDVELVKLLLDESDITLDDANALHYATSYCDPKVVKELLDLNLANVNLKNSRGYTPLHLAAMRGEPAIIVTLLTKNPIVTETTLDGGNAISICRRLTSLKDYNTKMEQGQESNKYRLCIDILEREMMRNAMDVEDSATSSLFVDDIHTKLHYLENRVAFARLLFPAEAKVAMQIAKADTTSEFVGLPATNDSDKLREVDLNETPSMRNKRLRDRVESLVRTVQLGRRYFPNCSEVLDKCLVQLLEDDHTDPFFLKEGTPEEQSMKRVRFSEVKRDVYRAFSKDKAEALLTIPMSPSPFSPPPLVTAMKPGWTPTE